MCPYPLADVTTAAYPPAVVDHPFPVEVLRAGGVQGVDASVTVGVHVIQDLESHGGVEDNRPSVVAKNPALIAGVRFPDRVRLSGLVIPLDFVIPFM